MLKLLILLIFAIAGLSALPLRKAGTGHVMNVGRERHVPLHRPMEVGIPLERRVVPGVPADNRRQGTEPSRRFLVDLHTGLLKDYVGEMSRRPSGFYVPPPRDGFRQGTENSHATLVDSRTGLLLQSASEMMRGHIADTHLVHSDEFRDGIESSWLEVKDTQGKETVKEEKEVVAVPLVKGGWMRDGLSLDPIQSSGSEELNKQVLRAAPEENRRQGTEPSRRFLVDLRTGLLKDYVGEMRRRPSGFYVPPPRDGFRQGTENSHATLVDSRTGLLLQSASEMMRGHITATIPLVLDEFKHGIEYSQFKIKDDRLNEIMEPVDDTMEGEVHYPAEEVKHDIDQAKATELRVNPVNTVSQASEASMENRRQGTEPSRRFLVDLRTGLLKDYVGEMNRRPSGFYVPPPRDGFRQGTENSHATLVDSRTGLLLQSASEMMRGHVAATIPLVLDEFKHGLEYSQFKIKDDRQNEIMEPVDNPMEVSQASEAPMENRRLGTEPSRRFLVDLRTGLLKDYVGEMSRRPSGFYVPPPRDDFRQGTENSHATLVDSRTGLLLQSASEMQRGHVAATIPLVLDEFKHGIEYSQFEIKDDRQNEIMEPVHDTMEDEFSHSMEYSHFKMRNEIMDPAKKTEKAVWLKETLPVDVTCSGEIIDGRCYQFNPTPLTFSEAESFCQDLYADGHIAAVTSADLHTRIVSMAMIATNGPALTWLGGVKKGQRYEWLDGSAWGYTDWMPGHPNLQRGRVTCVEMFRMEVSWWTSVDCNLKRASICSFPMAA
ncbi:uncharacterized protein wu:fa56d06 isoform X2 [Clupea harengus]|uniref:Uncharacterized protein wu:fa56d06 isoform X2 n=1 Tax=Clupea harengus TaxID=7950 RepID=A0A6P8GGX8_CLUHA|nr:uncharacterized protein wu:fa56d06 isoform X2 [Clupea harengus]